MMLSTGIVCLTLVHTCMSASPRAICHPGPPSIPNAYYMTEESSKCSYTYGFGILCTVQVVCNDGYTINGTTDITMAFVYCEYFGMERGYQWSEIPVCIGKPLCSNGRRSGVSKVKNGDVVISGGVLASNIRFTVGTSLETTCKPGHRMIGKPVRSCLPTGRWTAGKPKCKAVTCDPLHNATITNGWSDAQNRTYYRGDEINFYCSRGYRTIGHSWRVCYEDSNRNTGWSGETPVCEVVRCTDIGIFENGDAFLTSIDSDLGERTPGSVIDFRCYGGYELIGPAQVKCKRDGRWSNTSVCDVPRDPENPRCRNPGIPYNGRKTGTRYDANEIVSFTCNAGYTLIGSSQRSCLCNGDTCAWGGEQPRCRGPHEFDNIDDLMKGLVDKTSSIANDTEVNLTPSARFIDVNYEGGWNIYFVLGASNSVGDVNFGKGIKFAQALVSKVGNGKVRYGAVVFASAPVVLFNPAESFESVADVHEGLELGNRYAEERNEDGGVGGGTRTRAALTIVLQEFIPSTPLRDGSKTAVFLITDGQSNEGGTPIKVADVLKAAPNNVAFYCIGVGNDVDAEALTGLASEPHHEHLFLLSNYNDVESMAYAVTNQEEVFTQCGVGLGPLGGNNPAAQRGRIIGGNNAPEGAWPWMAGIYKQLVAEADPEHFCGGTLISPDWILSAAQCFDKSYHGIAPLAEQIKVMLGSTEKYDRLPGQLLVNVGEIIIHPDYNSSAAPRHDYDVALLRIDPEHRVELSRGIRTICIPEGSAAKYAGDLLNYGEKAANLPFPYVAGWGTTQALNDVPTDNLKQIALPLKGRRTCVDSIVAINKDPADFSPRMRCAGFSVGDITDSGEVFEISDKRDSCGGDTGGPLMRQRTTDGFWYQIGIVSWGYGCARQGQYGYYTDVLQFSDWIKEEMEK